MRKFLPKLVQWRVLKLTKRYQNKAPVFEKGRIVPGRINLTNKPAYNKKLIRLLVRDKTLAEYLTATDLPERQNIDRIAEYALKKMQGNKQRARQFLNDTMKQIGKGLPDYAVLKKTAIKGGLSEQQAEIYVDQTVHLRKIAIWAKAILEHSQREIK